MDSKNERLTGREQTRLQQERPRPGEDGSVYSGQCEVCGYKMYGLHCKIICPNCGYRRDCSDP